MLVLRAKGIQSDGKFTIQIDGFYRSPITLSSDKTTGPSVRKGFRGKSPSVRKGTQGSDTLRVTLQNLKDYDRLTLEHFDLRYVRGPILNLEDLFAAQVITYVMDAGTVFGFCVRCARNGLVARPPSGYTLFQDGIWTGQTPTTPTILMTEIDHLPETTLDHLPETIDEDILAIFDSEKQGFLTGNFSVLFNIGMRLE